MNQHFKYISEQIPTDMITGINMKSTDYVMLVKTDAYLSGLTMLNRDYNFSFPVSTPPPTLIDAKEYNFHKGRMIFFPPDTEITAKASTRAKEYISLSFKKEYLQGVLWEIEGKKQLSFRYNEYGYNSKLTSMLCHLDEEICGSQCLFMLQSITAQIAVEILRQTGVVAVRDVPKGRLQEHYITDAIEYIQANFSSNISLHDICRHINITPYHFVRLFKKGTGLSPHAYLLSTRLTHARELIEKSAASIEEIGKKCGFINSSHFAACFKRQYGITPTGYRKVNG